jgi:hypothetical protein
MLRPLAANISLNRMVHAVEKVRQRLLRVTAALEKEGVPYAFAGDNAVASWVSSVDEPAVRNTQDVDLLLRRSDLDAASAALATAGFGTSPASICFWKDPNPKRAMPFTSCSPERKCALNISCRRLR